MAGTKRGTNSNPNSSKNKIPSDLKRRKARVGKQAIKPANVTDTSFKAASLHVAEQTVDRSKSSTTTTTTTTKSTTTTTSSPSIPASERGKTLAELMSQLGHPAAPVRCSAMKGIQNIVVQSMKQQQLQQQQADQLLQSQILQTHLSVLLSACGKSSVDDDPDVRQVGLAVLQDVLHGQEGRSIKPFVPLLVAYATSALHSLDASMRRHGARMTMTLCHRIPQWIYSYQAKLLPPFVNLLSDRGMAQHSEEILQSLVALLKPISTTTTTTTTTNTTTTSRTTQSKDADGTPLSWKSSWEPDLRYALGSRSCNALILDGWTTSRMHRLRRLESLQDLPALDQMEEWYYDGSSSSNWTSKQRNQGKDRNDTTILHDLLSKLRDILVETTDTDHDMVQTRAPMNITKVIMIIQSIRLVWNSQKTITLAFHDVTGNDDKLEKLGLSILSLLLDMFPIHQDDIRCNDYTRLQDLNSEIAMTIMGMASSMDCCKIEWIDPLCSYLLPRLDHRTNHYASSSLEVLGDLLLLRNGGSVGMERRMTILEKLYTTFMKPIEKDLIRSLAGRKVMHLVRTIWKQHEYRLQQSEEAENDDVDDNNDRSDKSYHTLLEKTLLFLPFCMVAWESDFLHETDFAIDLLHNVVRRINDRECPLFISLRKDLGELFSIKRSSMKTTGSERTVFERYPETIQRRLLSLVVMLESPSEETIKGLGTICARRNAQGTAPIISADLANHVVETLHSIRKTISMPLYLGFLVDSIGVSKSKKKKSKETSESEVVPVDIINLIKFDEGLKRSCRACIQCGSSKVLQMLLPVFLGWLDASPMLSTTDIVVRHRIAIAMLGIFSLDMQGCYGHSSIFDVAPELVLPVSKAICRTAIQLSTCNVGDFETNVWSCPIVSLIQSEPRLLGLVFKEISEAFVGGTVDQHAQGCTIHVLMELVRDQKLATAISKCESLIDVTKSMEAVLSGGPHAELAARLRAMIEFKLEHTS